MRTKQRTGSVATAVTGRLDDEGGVVRRGASSHDSGMRLAGPSGAHGERPRWASLLAVLVLAGAVACGGGGKSEPALEEVLASPDDLRGETVTIEAAVSNPIDHRVWEMADGQLFVIHDRGLDRGLETGERLRVTGAVQRFDQQTIEGELGVNIEDHFFREPFLESDVAFVARSVERLD